MRKLKVCLSVIVLATLLFGSVAFALDGEFFFEFTNTTDTNTNYGNYGYRATAKGPGKDWSITINSAAPCNVSGTNIFGARPRKGPNDSYAALGAYRIYTSKSTFYNQYSTTVQCGPTRPVYLRGKKDNASTSSYDLTARGRYNP